MNTCKSGHEFMKGSKCYECNKPYLRAYYKKNREKILAHKRLYKHKYNSIRIKSVYGITEFDRGILYIQQRGKCAICGIPEDELKRSLDIDHCHFSGKVRGLLCSNCNHGIGKFKDKIEVLEKAIKYLKQV